MGSEGDPALGRLCSVLINGVSHDGSKIDRFGNSGDCVCVCEAQERSCQINGPRIGDREPFQEGFVVLPLRIPVGDFKEGPCDCQGGTQLVGSIGSEALLGRERVGQAIEHVIKGVSKLAECGGALVLSGEAGVRKSALLDAVRTSAVHRGLAMLTTSGSSQNNTWLLLPAFRPKHRRPAPRATALCRR